VSNPEEMVDSSLRLCWHINGQGGFEEYQKQFFSILYVILSKYKPIELEK